MATFNPTAIEGHIYKNGKLCIKILSFNGITAHAVILDENMNPSSDEKDYTEFQWKQAKFNDITGEQSKINREEDSIDHTSSDNLPNAPELPPITFAYDHEKKSLLVLNRRGIPVQEISVMTIEGKNGISAFDVWKEWRQLGDETPISAFYDDIKGKDGQNAAEWTINSEGIWCRNGVPTVYRAVGKDGKDGKSAYEQWAENQPAEMRTPEKWLDSLQGKDGVNGLSAFEEWKSLLPEERRNATLSDFFSWLVKQTEEKIEAKEGATWVPNFVDGKIVFQNNRTKAVSDAYIVKGKDGKSFTPKIVDEKLTFVDDNGNEVTPRHDYRGKSAFELWQEQPENEGKTLKDFFDFLKGEKGDQGLDGIVREAKHSYLDIKDHICPVQKIDTSLLVNVSDSAKSPEAIVDERINEINEKREAGKNERASRFKEFFWWCAGADRALLRKCPSDHSKYVGIGSVILFTALMAWFSSFIAMKLVFGTQSLSIPLMKGTFDFPIWAALFATFWGSMIFFLDRFITNTMYSDGEVTISKDEFIGGLPRILIAIFLGIVISAPLELKIFEKEIDNIIDVDLREKNTLDDVSKKNATIKSISDSIAFYEKKVVEIIENKSKIPNLQRTLDKAEKEKRTAINKVPRYQTKSLPSRSYYNSDEEWQEACDKIKKDNSERADEYYERLDKATQPYVSEINNLEKQINDLTADPEQYKNIINNFQEQLNDIDEEYNNTIQKKDSVFRSKIGISKKLQALHYIAMEGYNVADDTLINKAKNDIIKLIVGAICFILSFLIWWYNDNNCNIKKRITCFIISLLIGVIGYFCYNTICALIYYLCTPIGLIMLLFIMIDISPVLYKMMLADGVYDKYLQEEKQLKQSKIRLSLARMVRKIDKSELKALSPFIMGDFYHEMKSLNIDCSDKESGDIKWGKNSDALDNVLEKENKKLFETVLEYKKRIILASYSAWYRDMRDALIGTPDDSTGEKISPEEILLNDTNFDNTNQTTKDSYTDDNENHNDINSGSHSNGENNINDNNMVNQDSSDDPQNKNESKETDTPNNNDDEYERVV